MSKIGQVGLGLFLLRHVHNKTSRNLHSFKKDISSSNQLPSKTVLYFTALIRNLTGSTAVNKNWNALTTSTTLLYQSLHRSMSKVPQSLRKHSDNIVRMCTQQCECVIAHKLRRGQQIVSLYSRLWDELAFKQFLHTLQQQIGRRGRIFMLSAVGLSSYDWDKQRISDHEIFGHINEMDYIYALVKGTMTCNECGKRQVVNSPVANIPYCKCKKTTPAWKKSIDDWLPFIEGEDMLIWKKEIKEKPGMIAYKVFGTYNDVTAEDFLQVQMDVQHRMEWDPTAVKLNIVDEDPTSNSDVVYWEMEWPRLFANRDYVFKRRFVIDSEKKVMLIVNEGTTHPNCPETTEKYRVNDYWSFMVIRPFTEFNEPGIEFGLTYFDNPGIAIPSAVTAWVAMSGLPNFLMRLRQAARDVGLQRSLVVESSPEPSRVPVTTPAPTPAQHVPLPSQESQNVQLSPNSTTDTYFQQFRVLFI